MPKTYGHVQGPIGVHGPHDLDKLFTYYVPNEDQANRYVRLEDAGKVLAIAVLDCCPPGDDRDYAIRLVRQVVMTASAGIVIGEAG